MVKRCTWGKCKADTRYPERLQGHYFVPFPKPKTQIDKCLRWITACGRPKERLNTGNINKHKFVCSKHFVGGKGPTETYPDPIPADGTIPKPARPPPKRRRLDETVNHKEHLDVQLDQDETAMAPPVFVKKEQDGSIHHSQLNAGCQAGKEMDDCEDVSYTITKQFDSDESDDSADGGDTGDRELEAPPHPTFLWSASNEHDGDDSDEEPVYRVTVFDFNKGGQGVTETHTSNGGQSLSQEVNPENLYFTQSKENTGDDREVDSSGCLNTIHIKQEPFDALYSNYEHAAVNSNESNRHLDGYDPDVLMNVKQEPVDSDFDEATLRLGENGGNMACTSGHLNFTVKQELCDEIFSDSNQQLWGFNDLPSEEGIHDRSSKRCKFNLDTSEQPYASSDTCDGEGSMDIKLEPKEENSDNESYGKSVENTETNSQCTEATGDADGLYCNTRSYACDFNCGKFFRNHSQYARHLRFHMAPRSYKCDLCPKKFQNRSRLLVHVRTHTGEKPFSCSKCGKGFATKGTLNRHHFTHFEKKPALCTVCNKLFPSADGSGLTRHWEKEHKGQRPYQCNSCSMEFDDISSFISHHKIHGDTRERLHAVCSTCGKTFADQRILLLHKQLHGSSQEYMCTECGKRFTVHAELLAHCQTHSGERTYKCDICDMAFVTKGHLMYHQSTHGEYATKCDKCGKQVTQSISQHWEKDHPGEKPFQCAVCDQEFVNIDSFIQHSKLAHKFQCKVCKEEFTTKGRLALHHHSSSCSSLEVKSAS